MTPIPKIPSCCGTTPMGPSDTADTGRAAPWTPTSESPNPRLRDDCNKAQDGIASRGDEIARRRLGRKPEPSGCPVGWNVNPH
jgi:hypothetical protein